MSTENALVSSDDIKPPEYNTLMENTNALPSVKLCLIKRWPDFQGFGFSLKAIKGEVGQRIGEVDPMSPSASVDLRDGDRIFKVNGFSVLGLDHREVVKKVLLDIDKVELLVADREAELVYQSRDIDILSPDANIPVEYFECPDVRPGELMSELQTGIVDNNHKRYHRFF